MASRVRDRIPSAPMIKSAVMVSPFVKVTEPAAESTAIALWLVTSLHGVPEPSSCKTVLIKA